MYIHVGNFMFVNVCGIVHFGTIHVGQVSPLQTNIVLHPRIKLAPIA